MEEKEKRPLMDSAEMLRGASKSKKSKLPLIASVCVVIIICAGALLTMFLTQEQPTETASLLLVLAEVSGADVESIQVASAGESYTLINDNDNGYSIEGKADFRVDASAARRMIAQSSNLNAQSIVNEKAEDLSQYGLADPSAKVCVQIQNGESFAICIGDQSPVSSYYACIDGRNAVYAIAPTVAETLMKPLKELHTVETPAIAEPYAPAYLRIEWPDVTEKRGMRVLEIQKHPRKDIGIGASNYLITEPFTYDVDVAALAALVENIASIKAETYAGEMADAIAYGMQGAVKLVMRDTAGTEVIMEIGGQTENQQRYLKFGQDRAIYTIAAEKVAFLEEITLAGSVDRFISLVGIDKVEEITISAQGRVDVICIDAREKQTLYIVNGREVGEDTFKTFYQELCALTANGIVMEAEQLSEPEIVMQFKLAGGVELLIEYLDLDRENYAVRRDGNTYVYVQKSKLAQLLEKLYGLE